MVWQQVQKKKLDALQWHMSGLTGQLQMPIEAESQLYVTMIYNTQ